MPLMSARTMRVGSEISEIRRNEDFEMRNLFTERNDTVKFPQMADFLDNVKQMVKGVVSDVKNLVTHQKEEPTAVN